MPVADLDYVAFGIIVGGTDHANTTVFTDIKQIKMICFSGNATPATCVIRTKDPSGAWVICHKFNCTSTNELNSANGNYAWFGEKGSTFNGMQVDNGHANDHLFIHVV